MLCLSLVTPVFFVVCATELELVLVLRLFDFTVGTIVFVFNVAVVVVVTAGATFDIIATGSCCIDGITSCSGGVRDFFLCFLTFIISFTFSLASLLLLLSSSKFGEV